MTTFGFPNRPEIEVESSNVRAFSYNSNNRKLRVEFKSGAVYEYDNVSLEDYGFILSGSMTKDGSKSASIGASVHQELVSQPKKHPFRKL